MFLFFHGYYNLVAGSKSTKGKPTNLKIQKQNPTIEVNDSDEISSLSSANNNDGDKDGSNDEDGENNEDEDVAQMSDRGARRMFDDEVFSSSSIRLESETISLSCPRLQMIQLHCSTTIMTSKSPLPSLIAASGGQAPKLHDPRHQNLTGCLTIIAILVKRRLMMTMTSLSKFSCLLEVLIG